ncbi:MAG: outer membrane lipoprotein carrier protein LolA [Rhodospirillales bacterium]|nr:outer membrane lipoprotein carrier protein LolA [Rhodospirillales bacterium]
MISLFRRVVIAAALAAPLLGAAPSPAGDRATLDAIAATLNAIHTMKAHFLQVAPDGSVSEGTAWVERPGHMRFQYAPPSPFLLVAGSGLVMFQDSSLHQTSTVPLGRTPLGILLAPHITLDGAVRVTALRHLPGEVAVTLIRAANPEQGSLTLVFSTSPMTLRQWSVLDAQHQRTTVTLYNQETGGRFDPSLFDVARPANGTEGQSG